MASIICLRELLLWMVILHFLGNALAMERTRAIKSIKTANGDIFDCVDTYKQPAFDHPLLKNHTIQMRPSAYLLKGIKKTEASTYKVPNIRLNDGGCPLGTVPIPRTQIKKRPTDRTSPNVITYSISAIHRALVETQEQGTFYGTTAYINVWNPIVRGNLSFSSSHIRLRGLKVTSNSDNQVEAGWHVNKQLYQDFTSRFYILWTLDGYRNVCYNFECPGYIQVSQSVVPGSGFSTLSVYNGTQMAIHLGIVKDRRSGNWFVIYGPDSEVVGYWPKEIFTNLRDKAEVVDWGGETYGRAIPQMGSGRFPVEGYRKACFIAKITIMDQGPVGRDLVPNETLVQINKPEYYRAIVGRDNELGTHVFFGGPGRN